MHTTHPCIMLGSYIWDSDTLPDDEFDARIAHLRAAMDANGWAAVLIYGDAREHQALACYTNFIPRMRWALAMIPAKGEPRILVSVTARDMPAMKTMTWVKDVYSGWEWKWFDGFIEKLPPAGVLATMGFELVTPVLYGQIEASTSGRFTFADASAVLSEARGIHRPRETALIRTAASIADAAGDAFLAAWRAGKDVENSALAAETSARNRAAQDVRTLVSRDGGRTLEPFRARFDDRPATLLGYVGVKYQGYWAEKFVCAAPGSRQVAQRASAALDAALANFKIGATADILHGKAREALGALPLHMALSGSLGHRIGLSANEGHELRPGGGAIAADVAYALRIGAHDVAEGGAIASAIVHLHGDGRLEILTRSHPE